MMEMKRQRMILLLLLGAAALSLGESAAVQQSVRQGLSLCARSVIPALLPFLVVSSLLVSQGFGQWAGRGLGGMMEGLFRLPGCGGAALALGFAAGYPVGARTAAELYREGQLTKEEAQRLLTFCNNANPAFLVTVLGRGVFHSARTGMWLWLIHVAAAFCTGLLFRSPEQRGLSRRIGREERRKKSFASAFVEAVGSGALAMVGICGFVTVFYVLSRPLAALPGKAGMLLTGLTELFSLTPRLTADGGGFVIAAACAGFGGVSVLCQTAAVLEGSDLSNRWCVTGKLVQGLFSAVFALIVWQWL